MHSLTKIPPLIRKEIYNKYKTQMRITRWKNKEVYYKELALFYRVHYNVIRKIILRWESWDFTVHKSTTKRNLWCNFKKVIQIEKRIGKRLNREKVIRYEKEMAWELVHIDLHKRKNIKWEDPKKKKYLAAVIDDATRINYTETLSNKKAKTLSDFIKRAYKWFKTKWITIKKLLSDNWLEFTTHHIVSRKYHSFETMLEKLNIVHKYTKVRRPQTNWKVERFWRIFEEHFFRKYDFLSNKDFNLKLMDWLVFYNTKRKHWWINYITPMQKLENLLENNLVCL
jgi:transposase InsO family protein